MHQQCRICHLVSHNSVAYLVFIGGGLCSCDVGVFSSQFIGRDANLYRFQLSGCKRSFVHAGLVMGRLIFQITSWYLHVIMIVLIQCNTNWHWTTPSYATFPYDAIFEDYRQSFRVWYIARRLSSINHYWIIAEIGYLIDRSFREPVYYIHGRKTHNRVVRS